MSQKNAALFFLAVIIVIGILSLLNRWEGTRVIVYYLLVLAIAYDIVIHYKDINDFALKVGLIQPVTSQSIGNFSPGKI